jgi:serine/threonine-protein kinase
MVVTASADPLIGSMLGKDYRVLEPIGMGGMAIVYLVEHQTLQKRFAAKVLSTEHASSVEARARFTQEAHAASQLDHENIVTISDFGITADQRPYFVMELLRGRTLADRLDEGPMTLEEVVAVCVPVARGLAYAHAEGIIHRDVKPENIFLVQRTQNRWSVKILDFGIAKVPVNDRMTKTGQALGSPMFMAPEACKGDDVDRRADVYSFGILLYLMLTGRVPFEDNNLLKVLQMQVSSPLPLPSSYNPELPPSIESVVIRALAKDADDRYSSIDEMLMDFQAALPDGADVMLLQAQFGVAQTPFPGSLQQVRNSGLFPATSTGQIATITGRHNLSPSGSHRLDAALPTAPRRTSKALLFALIALLAVGGGGVGAYLWMEQRASTDASPPVAAAPPAASPEANTDAPAAVLPREAPAAAAKPVEDAPTPNEPVPDEPAALDPPVVETTPPRKPTKRVAAAPKTAPKKTVKPPPPSPAVPVRAGSSVGSNVGSATVVAAVPPDAAPVAPPIDAAPKPAIEPVAQPTRVSPEVPKKPSVGSLDATPTVASLDVSGSLPSSVVQRAVERVLPALRECYKTAVKKQQATPAVTLSVTFEIDESSGARGVAARGGPSGLASCAKGAIERVQTRQAPDVGTVHVVLSVKFTPL